LVHELGREQPKTTRELLDIMTRHASNEETVGATFILGNVEVAADGGRTAPTKATVKGAWKSTKGSEKRQKQGPRRIAIVAGKGRGDKGVGDFDEECIAIAKRGFKCQMRPPKDHFEKLLKATYPHHSYPVRHKLKDCNMMKKFMTSEPFSKGRKPGEDPVGKSVAPILGEAKAITIFDRPHRGPGNAT
jgi:hypothetical protein